jgi:hypothetical protein
MPTNNSENAPEPMTSNPQSPTPAGTQPAGGVQFANTSSVRDPLGETTQVPLSPSQPPTTSAENQQRSVPQPGNGTNGQANPPAFHLPYPPLPFNGQLPPAQLPLNVQPSFNGQAPPNGLPNPPMGYLGPQPLGPGAPPVAWPVIPIPGHSMGMPPVMNQSVVYFYCPYGAFTN